MTPRPPSAGIKRIMCGLDAHPALTGRALDFARSSGPRVLRAMSSFGIQGRWYQAPILRVWRGGMDQRPWTWGLISCGSVRGPEDRAIL